MRGRGITASEKEEEERENKSQNYNKQDKNHEDDENGGREGDSADLIRFSRCRSPCYSITVYYIAFDPGGPTTRPHPHTPTYAHPPTLFFLFPLAAKRGMCQLVFDRGKEKLSVCT